MSEAAPPATEERHSFGAEVGRLLDLVVHSLYSEREIFLRELVANAADATDRRRFEALTNPALGAPANAGIRVVPDRPARTLTIADEGIGMTPRRPGAKPRHHRPLRHPRLHRHPRRRHRPRNARP